MNPTPEQRIAMDAAEKAIREERARVERLFDAHLCWHTVDMSEAALVRQRCKFIAAVRSGEDAS
jgi:hypothetical protein